MFGFQWDAPQNIFWFPIIIIIMCVYYYRQYKTVTIVNTLAHSQYLFLVKHFSYFVVIIKIIAMTIACLALGLALLSPTKVIDSQQVSQQGRNLFIALDVSRSMSAVDCVPNRLSCAKEKIKELVDQFKSEKVGLILFAGSAFVYCPLTNDYQTFFQLLESVDLQTISSTNTALDKPILCALSAFEKSNAQHKLLLLVTDGEDFGNRMPEAIAHAHQQQLCVSVLGIGTAEGSPIPLYNQKGEQIGHQKDKEQKIVISSLQESILKKLAIDLKGIYYTATKDNQDIMQLIRFIEKRDKENIGNNTYEIKKMYYHYCLLIAVVFLIIEWLL